jgi:tRNA threonylcarbamoyladenosine biosynthesis protein TsaE
MTKYNISTFSQLDIAAFDLANFFKNNKIAAFYGQMGAGKTTLIKAICKALGVKEIVTSPTFAIVNEYELNDKSKIFHFDFYRFNSINEAISIGFEEYLYSGNYCFIEWPEIVEPLLPENTIKVNILTDNINERILIVNE